MERFSVRVTFVEFRDASLFQGRSNHTTASSSPACARPGMKWSFSSMFPWSVFGRRGDFIFFITGRRTFPVTHISAARSHLQNERQQMKGRMTMPVSSALLPRTILRCCMEQLKPSTFYTNINNTTVKPLEIPLEF